MTEMESEEPEAREEESLKTLVFALFENGEEGSTNTVIAYFSNRKNDYLGYNNLLQRIHFANRRTTK